MFTNDFDLYNPSKVTFPMNHTEFIISALLEDAGPGDHSTDAVIDQYALGKAVLKIKEDCILAGVELAEAIFKHLQPSTQFVAFKKDGDFVHAGDIAFEVSARIRNILLAERLVLNTMQRMSGIASLTNEYVQLIKDYPTQILDTRKTTPLFRAYEKWAVTIGGGKNHRMGLYDMIMLKDNHIDYCGGIAPAIERTLAYLNYHHLDLKIEIETRNLQDIETVLAVGNIHRIMLDNFSPEDASKAVALIDKRFEVEASGGINKDNILAYAQSGVDFISVGALIHQATSKDLSLKAVLV